MKESIGEGITAEKWNEAYDAQNEKSPTFSETTRVSANQNIETIEAYLAEHPDLDEKERVFLEVSIALKRQNQKNKEKDIVHAQRMAEGIQASLKNPQEERLEAEDIADARKLLADFHVLQEKYDIKDNTMIKWVGEDIGGNKYWFSDPDAMKRHWFSSNKKGAALFNAADIATYMGCDLSEGKTVKEVMDFIAARINPRTAQAA